MTFRPLSREEYECLTLQERLDYFTTCMRI